MKSGVIKYCLNLFMLLYWHCDAIYGQCPGELSDPYYFCGSISSSRLDLYLDKAAAFAYVTEPGYLESEFDEDIIMLQLCKPKWLGRVAGQWAAGSNDAYEYSTAAAIAERIHNEVDPLIILQAGIYEHVDSRLSITSDWHIQIPDSIRQVFTDTLYPGYTGYFEFKNIVYQGHDIPDMSKPEAQMWFYYRAINYINAGYEALHLGQFMVMNNLDTLNLGWQKLLQEIRLYAGKYARRKMVFIDCHFVSTNCPDINHGINDKPYVYRYKQIDGRNLIVPTDTLLFDYISFTLLPDEYHFPISDNMNPYDGSDRLCLINYKNCSLFNESFNGICPQLGNEIATLPMLVELDNGGAINFDCEGEKTDETYACNADLDGGLETPEYLTWGFGGESVWYALQSPAYRHYFAWYGARRVQILNTNCHFRQNLRMPITYSQHPWPGIIYNAGNDAESDAAMINFIWNTNIPEHASIDFLTHDWTIGETGLMTNQFYRITADINGDGIDEVLGVKDVSVQIMQINSDLSYSIAIALEDDRIPQILNSKTTPLVTAFNANADAFMDLLIISDQGIYSAISLGDTFQPFQQQLEVFTNTPNWFQYPETITIGDINADGISDLIYVEKTGIWVAHGNSEPAGFSEFELWVPLSDLEITWDILQPTLRVTDINGDAYSDIIFFSKQGTYIYYSNGSSAYSSEFLIDNFCFDQGWSHSTPRFVADLSGDNQPDLLGVGQYGVVVNGSPLSSSIQTNHWIYGLGNDPLLGGYDFSSSTVITGDLNGDGRSDLAGFGGDNCNILLSSGLCLLDPILIDDYTLENYDNNRHSVLCGNFIGNSASEIIIFGEYAAEIIQISSSFGASPVSSIKGTINFEVYPNPAQNYFAISFDSEFKGSIAVYNTFGELIIPNITISDDKYKEIKIPEHIPAGMLIVVAHDLHNNTSSKKIIHL